MRRLNGNARAATALLAVLTAIGAGACRKPKAKQDRVVLDDTAGILPVIHASDPRAAVQLLRGFHELENNAWRWTTGEFAVALHPPNGAAQKGARLLFKFTLPDGAVAKIKSVTLSAKVNGVDLAPETYSKPGDFTYDREVPASALNADSVTATFKLDKFIAANDGDQRDLGVIMTLVGFESK